MKFIFVIFAILMQSCAILPKLITVVDCSEINAELGSRYSLFSEVAGEEVKKRSEVNVETVSALEEFSVVSEIVKSIKSAEKNAKLIPVDLRHYKNVSLGNIIISNISSDRLLEFFLKTSKFSQGFFTIINFNKDAVTIVPPTAAESFVKNLKREKIDRGDLSSAELVLNVSDSQHLGGNMKFPSNQKISIIADRITMPYRLDVREASNMQFNRNQQWVMSVYSIEESSLIGGKDTTGLFKFVNNKNTKEIKLDKFTGSRAACYTDPSNKKLGEERLRLV